MNSDNIQEWYVISFRVLSKTFLAIVKADGINEHVTPVYGLASYQECSTYIRKTFNT